jgi:hypothetical protein
MGPASCAVVVIRRGMDGSSRPLVKAVLKSKGMEEVPLVGLNTKRLNGSFSTPYPLYPPNDLPLTFEIGNPLEPLLGDPSQKLLLRLNELIHSHPPPPLPVFVPIVRFPQRFELGRMEGFL